VAQFNYRFVSALQRQTSQVKVWEVATVDGKPDDATGKNLVDYSNTIGQDAWELVSDSVYGASRELVFRHTTE
jgi:hypothetical protein